MGKPYVVGIAGGSASGKSTLVKYLSESLVPLSVKEFHLDSYFKPQGERPYSKAPYVEKSYVDDNHPLTMDLPKASQDIADAIARAEFDVVIVEGLLTLHDESIRRQCDLKLFVDCRSDERIVRRLRRNMEWGLSFDEISGVFLDLVRYRHDEYVEPSRWRADFVLNGSGGSKSAFGVLVSHIRNMVNDGE